MQPAHHEWLVGPDEPAWVADLGRGPAPIESGVVVIDCAQAERQAGACSELVRRIHPWLLAHDPAAIRSNYRTVRILAPELFCEAGHTEPRHEELTPAEVRLLAYGLPELLHAWGSNGAATVVLLRADTLDATDAELVATLLHALPPELVRLVIHSPTEHIPPPLRDALTAHVQRQVPK